MKRCKRPATISNIAKPCDCDIFSNKINQWVCDESYGECEHQGEEIIEDEKI